MLVPGATGVIEGARGDPSAAWLALGPGLCLAFAPLPIDPFDPGASVGPCPAYGTAPSVDRDGGGYERPDWQPVGRIAMGFLDPAVRRRTSTPDDDRS